MILLFTLVIIVLFVYQMGVPQTDLRLRLPNPLGKADEQGRIVLIDVENPLTKAPHSDALLVTHFVQNRG